MRVRAIPIAPVALSGIPVTLTAVTASGNQINLAVTYGGIIAVTSYQFYMVVGFSWVLLASQSSASYAATGLTPNTTYTFEATVTVADGRTSMPSAVVNATTSSTLTAPTPTISPATGAYTGPVTVTISDSLAGSSIYYTTNNTTPIAGSSPLYTGAFTVSASATVQALATASGYIQSAVASATYTISSASGAIYQGGNFGGVGSTEQPYLNLLNSGQGPANLTGWSNSGSTTYPQILAVLDSNGYPTSLPGGNEITTFLDASLNDQDPLNVNGSGIGNGAPPGAATTYPSGSYTLQFQGACTIVFSRDVTSGSLATSSTNVSVSGLTITSTMTSTQSGVVTFNVSSPGTSGIQLNITALPSNTNYFRNASVVRTSQVANYNAGARFDPNWIASVTNNGAGGLKRLRFMDDLVMAGSYNNTNFGNMYLQQVPALTTGSSLTQTMTTAWNAPNGTYPCVLGSNNGTDLGQNNTVTVTYQSTTAVFGSAFTGPVSAGATNLWIQSFSGWSTRNVSTSVFWGNANGNGSPGMIPYETAIAMCNATNTDCWLNIPVWANSFVAGGPHPFWTSLAQLVQSNLNPGLKCYLEIGNEIFIEPDEAYCNMLAKTMFGVGDFTSFLGLQYALLSQAFQAVFGSSFASTIMVGPTTEFSTGNGVAFLEGQMNGVSINGGVYPNSFLAAKPYTYFTHWSVAPYWGSLSSADAVTMMGTTTPLDEFFACLYSNTGTAANGSHTYASASEVVPAGGATVTGWLNIVTAVIANMKSQIASQPWANYPVHCYESGPGFSTNSYSNSAGSYTGPYGGGTYTTIRSAGTAFIINANRDPRMGYALYDPTHQLSSNPGFLPAAVTAGVTTMNYYDNCRSESASGPWGALSNVMQLPSSGGTATAAQIPKYSAIMNWIEGIVPTTFQYFISTTGSDSNVGSLASPWSITALSTHQSVYAGKNVGIIAGTYSVGTQLAALGTNNILLNINGGPSTSQKTYIAACNTSGQYLAPTLANGGPFVVIDCGTTANQTNNAFVIGCANTLNSPTPTNLGNFILDGIAIRNFWWTPVLVGAQGGSPVSNWVIQNCEIGNGSQNQTTTHPAAIDCGSSQNGLVTNCWIHDIVNTAADADHQTGLEQWGFSPQSFGLTVDHCTFTNSPGVYVVSRAGDVVWGTTVQYCFFDLTKTGVNFNSGRAFFGGSCLDSPSSQLSGSSFHHNIVKGGFSMQDCGTPGTASSSSGTGNWVTTLQLYNNTWDLAGYSAPANGFRMSENAGQSGLFSCYNNLFFDNGAGNFSGPNGYVASNVDGFAVLNYNIYGTKNAFTTFPSGATSITGANEQISFASWKTATGGDANSTTNATNPFNVNFSSGILAAAYQVASGSVAFQAGKVGGISSGATCNAGAWDGTVTQIGCSFAQDT